MVKLTGFPDPGVVRAFKGSIDFYESGGQYRARSWPRWTIPGAQRSAKVRAQQVWLELMNTEFNQMGPYTRGCLQHPTRPGTWTTRDWFAKMFFCKLDFPFMTEPPLHPHSTPYPFPDPNNHYGSVLGSRVRLEPAGTQHLDLKMNTSAPPGLMCTNAAIHGLPQVHWKEFWYTRRGIPFLGGSQILLQRPNYVPIMPTLTSYGATYDITSLGVLSPYTTWQFQIWRWWSPAFDYAVWHFPLVSLFPWPLIPPPVVQYYLPLILAGFEGFYPASPLLGPWPRTDPTFW